MQSLIVTAKYKNESTTYIYDLLKKEGVSSFDINLQADKKALGIEDVRNIQKAILLKPFRSKTKAVIIDTYEGITLEAQNALLKVLEEPPINTIIVITVAKKELLLPTIISRCKIIELAKDNLALDGEENTEYLKILESLSLSKEGIGYKLKLAQDITRNKDEVVLWLEKMAICLRKKMIENHRDSQYLDFLKNLQKTYTIMESTNVNQRIALENLFLSF